jgi:hypothetical protein
MKYPHTQRAADGVSKVKPAWTRKVRDDRSWLKVKTNRISDSRGRTSMLLERIDELEKRVAELELQPKRN